MTTLFKPSRPKLKLYFAYGSNLSKAQMQERCPACLPVEPFLLTQFRLEFVGAATTRWGPGGVATISPSPVRVVPGAIYRINKEDEAALDRCEGVDYEHPELGSYYKEEALIFHHGEPVLVYIATARLGPANPPSAKYLEVIRQGYSDWDLPLSGLEDIRPIVCGA
jgi:gamma-glutamylcyclotransferase